eukprot:438005_1
MMQLYICIIFTFLVTITYSQPNNTENNIFWICNVLNEHGCNAPSIPIVVQAFIKQYASTDYYIPTDRCEFNTINLTTIQSEENVDLSLLSLVSSDIFTELPCEFLVQLPPDLLQDKNVDYLIDYDYWFTNDTYLNCNQSLIIDCLSNNNSNQTSNDIDNKNKNKICYLGKECLYPFVKSKYTNYYPHEAGMCHCNLDCRLRPFKWNLVTFDTILDVCVYASSIFLLIYFINVGTEWCIKRKKTNLAGDLPPIIAVFMFIFVILFAVPRWSRNDFDCENGTDWDTNTNMPKAIVYSGTLPDANNLCYISGVIVYICLIVLFNYFGLLSFVIYRSVSAPMNPLWNIKKRYWHLVMFIYTVILTAIAIQDNSGSISADPTFGTCGPSFYSNVIWYCLTIPGCLAIFVFVIFTPLNIYFICKHMKYGQNVASSGGKGMVNLYRRLIIYSILVALSAIGFLYVSLSMYIKSDEVNSITAEYVTCLVLNFQIKFNSEEQIDIIKNGNILNKLKNDCIMDANNKFPGMTLMG